MSSSLLLDGLLLLVVLLFIPIGLWRGGVREAIVAGGIVLGGALAGSWARPWGDDLASQLDLRPQTARFLVALAALLGATLCVGYAGGAALRPGAPGLLGRVAGGLLAGLNGLLLLGYGLGFLDQYVLEPKTVPALSDGLVSRFLMHQLGWVLLALVVLIVVGILTAVAASATRRDHAEELEEDIVGDAAMVGGAVTRPRPVRVPHLADAGKFEPLQRAGMPSDAGQKLGARLSDTTTTGLRASDLSMSDRPPPSLPPMETKPDRSTVSRDPERVEPGKSARAGVAIVDEWLRRAARPPSALADEHEPGDAARAESAWEQHTQRDAPMAGPSAPEPWPNSAGSKNVGQPSLHVVGSFQSDGPEEIETGRTLQDGGAPDKEAGRARRARRCRSCNARIAAADAYCSTCGSFAS